MAKKEYAEGSFGAYFVKLIKDHDYSQAKFASDLGVSKTYLFDVFNGRVKPPTPDMQDRIVELLRLTDDEKNDFYSKAADGRHELPKDIVEYVQTSIYIFEAGTPHNCEYDIVKFIDFRNDGYKRTERCIKEVDHPVERYQDLGFENRIAF